MALHALAYCERLFFLEEVEGIHLADERVHAGRILHAQLPEDEPLTAFTVESSALGLAGRFDALRRHDGRWEVIEHKRGRCRRGPGREPAAWDSDYLQAVAYALLLADRTGAAPDEVGARIRYHADRTTVAVAIDEAAQVAFDEARTRAAILRRQTGRPPPTPEPNRCLRCSLAPVCLPEEERLARDPAWDAVRLFPPNADGTTLHVLEHGDRVSRAGERLTVWDSTGRKLADEPIAQVQQVVVHGHAQVTTQALALCFSRSVQVHWLSSGGRYLGGSCAGAGGVQRRVRQYEALHDPTLRLALARRLVTAKVRDQLRHLLRVARQEHRRAPAIDQAIGDIRQQLARIPASTDGDSLRGLEGAAAAAYWSAFPELLLPEVEPAWRPRGRRKRPPGDACNALLSFLYALLYRDVVASILAVGLEPALGIHHTPRGQGYPLAEDLMELFRVPLVDLPVVASLNRRQWQKRHAHDAGPAGWLLTDAGRVQAIGIYEERRRETWRHPVTGYSLSYARLIELEVRLLEKTYSGGGDLFAKRALR
jgi:CRISPR-associated protein Cas1